MAIRYQEYYDFMIEELGINRDVINFALDTLGTKTETFNDVLYWAIGETDIQQYMIDYYDKDY